MSGKQEKKDYVAGIVNFVKKFPGITPAEKKAGDISAPFDGLRVMPWFTERNDFALQLLNMYESCNTHRACIETKANYATRNGFGLVQGKGAGILKTNTIAAEAAVEDGVIEAAAAWLEQVNSNGQTLPEVAHEMIVNLEATGNAFVELVRGGSGSSAFFSVYSHHAPSCLYALNADDTVTHVYVSSSWSQDYTAGHMPVKLPLYPVWQDINGAERCIIHLKSYSISRDYYGLPMFIAAFKDNLIEYEITGYNLEEFFKGFMPTVYMLFMGADGWEQRSKEKFIEQVQNTYTRKDRGGIAERFMVQVEESEKLKPFIHEFANVHKEGDFNTLKESAINSIHKGHRQGRPVAPLFRAARYPRGVLSVSKVSWPIVAAYK
jgi:hypothetical protein